jgi:putative ABC transport system permease protein
VLNSAWKSLRSRTTRTVTALLQSLLGAAIVTLALALAFAQGRIAASTPDVIQFTAGSKTSSLTNLFSMFAPTDLPKLQQLTPDVLKLDLMAEEYIPFLEVGQTRYKLSDSKATGPDYPALTGLKVLHGSYFNAKDVESAAKVVAISANTAQALYGKENAVGETLQLVMYSGSATPTPTPYRVVAITESAKAGTPGIASPLFKPVAINTPVKASNLVVQARPGRLSQAKEQLLSAAKQLYKNDSQVKGAQASGKSGFYFTSIGDPFDQAGNNTNTPMLRAYYAIAALTLIVSSLGVLAALLVSVNERTRELGMRRAIGATRGRIVSGLLLETGLTTFLGGLVGVGLALLLAPVLDALLNGNALSVTPPLALGVLGLFVALSLLFGLAPALLGTRMRPTEALRVQG